MSAFFNRAFVKNCVNIKKKEFIPDFEILKPLQGKGNSKKKNTFIPKSVFKLQNCQLYIFRSKKKSRIRNTNIQISNRLKIKSTNSS